MAFKEIIDKYSIKCNDFGQKELENIKKLDEKIGYLRELYNKRVGGEILIKIVPKNRFNEINRYKKDKTAKVCLGCRIIYTDGEKAFPANIDSNRMIRNNYSIIELSEIDNEKIFLPLIFDNMPLEPYLK